jgi:hypothetical protein
MEHGCANSALEHRYPPDLPRSAIRGFGIPRNLRYIPLIGWGSVEAYYTRCGRIWYSMLPVWVPPLSAALSGVAVFWDHVS